jgi:carbonic anhydrase
MKLIKIVLISTVFVFMLQGNLMAAPHWTHEEQATWGAIEDTSQTVVPLNYPYAECSIGKHQSPIDLAAAQINDARRLNDLEIWYDVDTPVFFNSGHGVQVNTSIDYPGELKIGEESFPLIQFHFHEPSEHVIGNTKFPAELHFVHVGEEGRLVVLAVAVNIGAENTTFQTILDNTPREAEGQNTTSGLQINPNSLLPPLKHNKIDYYTLAGSLTTPPCSEGVQWYLLPEAITISSAQLDQLKAFYTNNARSPQGLNGRVVQHQNNP